MGMEDKDKIFYENYGTICKTIVNPVRLRIIQTIGEGKLNVSEIQKPLGISMSNLSNHLNALHRVGVLKREKQGNFIYYSLTEKSLLLVLENMRKVILSIAEKRNRFIL